ncbi:hypothetical protein [Desulfobacter vibrioformis]|uniref:hypothetical protein n=1 Tax=Desulfobacter vibrioformis TaxID=34031 RepID=UPI0006904035|nr:hypothetical protein [Desulfobacter vibrioformis]
MIIRTEKKANYTRLSNEFLLDETISDKARGTLARLLSRPDKWNLNVNYLVKTGKDGHTAIRSAIRELEEAGYIQREVSRHENGRIIGVEYIIHENRVKPCGDRPAPEQRTYSCEGTDLQAMPDNENETSLPGQEPESIPIAAQTTVPPEPEPEVKESQVQGAHIEVADITENHMRETVIKETAPIINTDIKQILRVTTTTTPEPVPVPAICDQAMPLPSSCPSNAILNLIPEKHKSPMVVTFVNKAIVDYPEREVEEAITYAAVNVRGGSMQFKAYLDKTLQNKWAEGYLETRQNQQGLSTWLPRGRFPNGTITGSKRMDSNYMAAAQFLTEMGVEV